MGGSGLQGGPGRLPRGPWEAFGRRQGCYREAPGRPRRGSREAPGRLPGGSREAPGSRFGQPRRFRGAQEGPWDHRGPHRTPQDPPRTPQEPPKNPLKSLDWRVMSEPARDHNAPKRAFVAALVCRGVFSKKCTAPRREAHFDGSAWLNRPKICLAQAFDKHGKL